MWTLRNQSVTPRSASGVKECRNGLWVCLNSGLLYWDGLFCSCIAPGFFSNEGFKHETTSALITAVCLRCGTSLNQ